MSALGLNEHHQGTVVNYMRFARYQRGQRLRAVDACFEELKDSRLNEDTFTLDEVEDMLDGLLSVVRGEVESELINTAHTNVLLLRQVFQQAEKWHLKLQADISELENRELLERIKDFEEMEFSGSKRDDAKSFSRLEPVNESGGAALLNMEIERLRDENERLRSQMSNATSHAVNMTSEKGALKDHLERTRAELERASKKRSGYSDEEVEELRMQMDDLKSAIKQNAEKGNKDKSRLEGDLTSSKHELLHVQEMLEMAEKELEKKVSQTAPFRNLKAMLQKKNEQMKELRRRLARYEDPED